ncbi:MAG: FAD-binding oxidoreductase [Rhizobiales bacterium]|nr:FAD-binding oxidoreductase [Hyphomicrobiales bacterium]NRB15630.1 FAD-binding oxidoreductase [Hyphomicrobiales bacterium]
MKYPNSYYNHSLDPHIDHPSLEAVVEADVCIIGGGLAGLTCALELAINGHKVVVLEAYKMAWGASGRNGGIVFPGFAQGQDYLEQKLGLTAAKNLFDLSLEGVDIVRQNIQQYNLQSAAKTSGILSVIRYNDAANMQQYCQNMQVKYGYQLDYIDQHNMSNYTATDKYYQANMDKQAFHFHPLNYCLAIAQQIIKHGGQMFEQSKVINMSLGGAEKTIITSHGRVKAKHVVLCGGGYSGQVFGKLQKSILPVATYVITTQKLGALAQQLIKTSAAIIDDRRAADYYRLIDDDRILWGGRITAKTAEPQKLAQLMQADMCHIYPELAQAKIEFAWSGLMAYARHRMPYIGKFNSKTPSHNVWVCSAFGGHGMNTAPLGGRLIAEAIADGSTRYQIFNNFKLQWNGGVFGPMAAQTTYLGMKIADWYKETSSRNK